MTSRRSPWAQEAICLPDQSQREPLMEAARQAAHRTWWWLDVEEIEKVARIVVEAYEKR